jgi:hypothetical protein
MNMVDAICAMYKSINNGSILFGRNDWILLNSSSFQKLLHELHIHGFLSRSNKKICSADINGVGPSFFLS